MAFCPKCGVEVEGDIRNCPLCGFNIPKVDEDGNDKYFGFGKDFPKQKDFFQKKNSKLKMLFVIFNAIIMISTSVLLLFIDFKRNVSLSWSLYGAIPLFSFVLYFSATIYAKKFYQYFVSYIIITLLMLYSIDWVDYHVTWFAIIGFPITIYVFISITILKEIASHQERKTFLVPGLFFIQVGILCFIIEACVDTFLIGQIELGWSIITALELLPLGGILILLHVFLPSAFYRRLKKYWHSK